MLYTAPCTISAITASTTKAVPSRGTRRVAHLTSSSAKLAASRQATGKIGNSQRPK